MITRSKGGWTLTYKHPVTAQYRSMHFRDFKLAADIERVLDNPTLEGIEKILKVTGAGTETGCRGPKGPQKRTQ